MTVNSYSSEFDFIRDNYRIITENIQKAAEKSGRGAKDITFLAATKTVDPNAVNYAIGLGLTAIGENRVQELLDKVGAYDLKRCDLQFIGRLQTNKIKYIMDKVSQIQSVDSIKQIKEISRLAVLHGTEMKVLAEVNVGGEESKGGVPPEALFEFIDEARSYPGVKMNGLMAIPPICGKKQDVMQYFSRMKQYYVDIEAKKMDNVNMSFLSMGMSSDYTEAIECGANMVRIGSSLFGKRN